jgi:6-phosphogluconolactonase
MQSSTEVKIYKNPGKVSKAIAREIKNLSLQTGSGVLNIALSGGRTPELLFAIMVEKHKDIIPWDKLHFWWVDERCVHPEDEDSNYKTAKELLFSYINIPGENIHRIKGENDPDEEAFRYSAEIKQNLPSARGLPVFDLILLGMGDDGHTASIFPDNLALIDDKKVCAVTEHPLSGMNRVTLTGSVIKNARRIFFMVTGENKAARISEIMSNDEAATLLPSYYIEPVDGILIWFIDEAAASLIN